MSQGQLQREKTERPSQDHEVEHVDYKPTDNKASEIIDDILDAIDEVLEENAQDFIDAFVQKGGQ